MPIKQQIRRKEFIKETVDKYLELYKIVNPDKTVPSLEYTGRYIHFQDYENEYEKHIRVSDVVSMIKTLQIKADLNKESGHEL